MPNILYLKHYSLLRNEKTETSGSGRGERRGGSRTRRR